MAEEKQDPLAHEIVLNRIGDLKNTLENLGIVVKAISVGWYIPSEYLELGQKLQNETEDFRSLWEAYIKRLDK